MRRLPTALVIAALGLSACGGDDSKSTSTSSSATTTPTATATSGTSTTTSSGGANTAAVVKAANAFLATLSSSQRDSLVFDFSDNAKTKSWSNLPAALSPRQGIPFGDMNAEQSKAGLALMKTALSDQGYTELEQTLDADDDLAKQPAGGGPGGPDQYGRANYYFTLYGEPSTSKEWLLQFTGHHFTTNIAYKGNTVTFGPEFAGSEPMTFQKDGKTIAPVQREADGFQGVIKALDASQKAKAKSTQSFDDLLLGAGNDGPFPATPEGVEVSDLSKSAQAKVQETIAAYIGDLNEGAAAKLIKAYVADFDKTAFTYAGSENPEDLSFYARIDGPKVWIEFSTQRAIVVSGNHYHSIYREQGNDYGA
jgi:Protein of unknown function (DUF3500)